MNAIEKAIEWKTQSGKKAIVRLALQTSRIVDADGDRCELACCELNIVAEVAGISEGFTISRRPVTVAGTTYPATIGRLAIPAAQLAEIEAVLAEIHGTPDWQAHERAEAAANVAAARYAAHAENLEKFIARNI